MKPRSVRCMKFFLTLFNIVFVFFALVVIAICVINMREEKTHQEKQSALSRTVLSFLLTLGFGLLATAVLGCIGALREHVKILYVHACFLIVLISVEVFVGVGAAILNTWVGGGSDLRIQFYKNSTLDDKGGDRLAFWDHLQSENQCCGVDGPQDYAILEIEIPVSCCSRAYPLRQGGAKRQLHSNCLSEKSYYKTGCDKVLREKKTLKGNIFISTGIIFTLLEVVCAILGSFMARGVASERRKLQQTLQAHFES